MNKRRNTMPLANPKLLSLKAQLGAHVVVFSAEQIHVAIMLLCLIVDVCIQYSNVVVHRTYLVRQPVNDHLLCVLLPDELNLALFQQLALQAATQLTHA